MKNTINPQRDAVYLSFGENCLTDNILNRHGIKSFTTPYSHGLSNIEYIIQLENDRYANFLNPEYLHFVESGGKQVLRLTCCTKIKNSYEKICMNGFEFTHHDVKKNINHKEAFTRRVNNLLNLNNKNLFIFYHHRYCPSTNIKKLLSDLYRLRLLYLNRCQQVDVIMFTQIIVEEPSERKLEYKFKNGIHVFTFRTLNIWRGADLDVFWAKCDDDLVQEMLNMVTSGLLQHTIWDRFKTSLQRKLLNMCSFHR